MTENPILQGNSEDFFLPNQGLGQGETLSILGKVIKSSANMTETEAQKVNFAMLVINAIAYIGIERFTTQLQDLGTFQNMVAQGQSSFGSIQAGLAELEENTYWDGKKAQFSNSLTNNFSKLSKFIQSVYQLFSNLPVSGANTSTPTWQNFQLAIPRQGGGYLYIQPFTSNGTPNGQDWTLVNDFVKSLNNYIFPSDPGQGISLPSDPQGASNNMPIYIAMALTEVQVKIDNYSQYMVDPDNNFIPGGKNHYAQKFNDGSLLNFLFGSFNSDAPLESIQNLASLLMTNYSDGSSYNGPLLDMFLMGSSNGFNPQSLLQPFADMMADYMENKYQGQSSGPSDPGGYIPGITGSTNRYSSLSLFANTNTSATQGTSELQTQTQQNSASAQEDTTQINSYDNIGQAIVAGVNQAQKMMTQGQTTS